MKLETQRLVLVPIADEAFESIHGMVTNDYIRKYLFDDEILSKAQVQSIVEASSTCFLQKQYGLWAIKTKETDLLVGFTGLWHFFDELQPQLLYALLPQYIGLGYATEASLKILDYIFQQSNFVFLDASCDTANQASHKVARRIGMHIVRQEEIDGKPMTFYRIDKSHYGHRSSQ